VRTVTFKKLNTLSSEDHQSINPSIHQSINPSIQQKLKFKK
jgi:hypothetical protein